MIPAIRSELLKFRTTRMWWGMAIPVLLLAAALAALFALLVAGQESTSGMRMPGLDDPTMVSYVYAAGLGMSRMLIMAIGIMCVGAEFRHRTLTATFLATPRRGRVMGAKVVAMLLIGAFYAVVHLVGAVGVGALSIVAKGYSPFPAEALRTIALSLLVLGLWGLIGLGIGVLIPNQVAALMVGIGAVWIVEPLLQLLIMTQSWGASVTKWFPGSATSAIIGEPASAMSNMTLLSWWAGALVLAAYAAVFTGLGLWLSNRRDIT